MINFTTPDWYNRSPDYSTLSQVSVFVPEVQLVKRLSRHGTAAMVYQDMAGNNEHL